MPPWAGRQRHAPAYWAAADAHERANGRLCKTIEFALPRELDPRERLLLAHEYVRAVARTDSDEPLPCTFAIHAGGGVNPHVHVMISERVNDGTPRDPRLWFSRAATKGKDAASGGARKTEDLKPTDWLERVRALWAELANRALEAAGRTERIDHRSYAARGIPTVPGVHLGPAANAMQRARRPSRRSVDFADAQAIADSASQAALQLAEEAALLQRELINLRDAETGGSRRLSLADLAAHNRSAAERIARRRPSAKPPKKGPDHDDDFTI